MVEQKTRKKGDIGQRLRQVRGNTSLVSFAGEVGSNKTSWSLYESEDRWPDLELLIRVREATGMSLDWLADGDGAKDAGQLDTETLASIIRGIEAETPNLDPESKSKLIVRFYEEFRSRTSTKSSGLKKFG